MRAPLISMLVLAVVLGGCRRDATTDQQTGSLRAEDVQQARAQLSPEVRSHLDAGNEAFRAERFQEALQHYRQATELDANVAAGWFGIYMAESALGNTEAADSAIRRARDAAPGASLLEPEPGQ